MSGDYLTSVATRLLGLTPMIRPRMPSRFESLDVAHPITGDGAADGRIVDRSSSPTRPLHSTPPSASATEAAALADEPQTVDTTPRRGHARAPSPADDPVSAAALGAVEPASVAPSRDQTQTRPAPPLASLATPTGGVVRPLTASAEPDGSPQLAASEPNAASSLVVERMRLPAPVAPRASASIAAADTAAYTVSTRAFREELATGVAPRIRVSDLEGLRLPVPTTSASPAPAETDELRWTPLRPDATLVVTAGTRIEGHATDSSGVLRQRIESARAPEQGDPSDPPIHVTIGRIEIRAAPPPPSPTRAPRPRPKPMGLDEYMRRKSRGANR